MVIIDAITGERVHLTTPFRRVQHQPDFGAPLPRAPDASQKLNLSGFDGPALRSILSRVEEVRLPTLLNKSVDSADWKTEVSVSIAQHEQRVGSIDKAVLPGGAASQTVLAVADMFDKPQLEIGVSNEMANRFMHKAVIVNKTSNDTTGQGLAAPTKSPPELRLAGLHHVCKWCDLLMGVMIDQSHHWAQFTAGTVILAHHTGNR
jgi:hypothetical protein